MNILAAWMVRHQKRRKATYTYQWEQARTSEARQKLIAVTDPELRAQHLLDLAISAGNMGHLHNQVHPPRSSGGRAVSLLREACVYRAMADVEQTRAYGTDRPRLVREVEAVAGHVLDRIAADPAGTRNPALLAELAAAVTPLVGRRAADRLATLGSAR